jgi:putative alpha-1,2-mannosidase
MRIYSPTVNQHVNFTWEQMLQFAYDEEHASRVARAAGDHELAITLLDTSRQAHELARLDYLEEAT